MGAAVSGKLSHAYIEPLLGRKTAEAGKIAKKKRILAQIAYKLNNS